MAADLAVLGRLTPTASIRAVTLPDLGHYRLLVQAGHDGDVLITGLPTDHLDDTLHEVLLVEVIVFGAAIVLVVVVGGWLVGLSSRPLTRVTPDGDRRRPAATSRR